MTSSVALREEPARTVVYLRRKGPFAGIPDALQVLWKHMESERLTADGPPVGVFFTDPRKVPEAEARWEMYWPIAEHRPDEEPGADGVGVRSQEKRNLVVAIHTGPYDGIAASYDRAAAWIGKHGYRIVGATEEAYLSEPDTPPEKLRTEIRFPVAHAPVSYA